MKKFLFFLVALSLASVAHADRVMLNNAEALSVPTSSALEWQVTRIDATKKILQVSYRFLDANSNPIQKPGKTESWRIWTCRDIPAQLVANCTGPGTPYACCTGVGTGTGCDPGSTCFSDVFAFVVRSQDVGTKIGVGLRSLIWNKFRPEVLTGANNGTFDIN